ncbi:MAG: hypothetical protein KA313_05255 [Pseudarcicella sp.]|nr:hypothetical protein [Pseudarcicella sp.]MBP6410486.1 hypothetical protein [Pseudarcicella sp.]
MTQELTILRNTSTGLNKNKYIDDIAKKITKIEKLENELKGIAEKLKYVNEVLSGEQYRDFIDEYLAERLKLFELCVEKYPLKTFNNAQKDELDDYIKELAEDFYFFKKDYLLSESYAKHMATLESEMSVSEKEMLMSTLKEQFADSGIDLDDSIPFAELINPNFIENYFAQMHEERQKQMQEDAAIEKAEKQANTDIDFQKIYKKLAKLSHPDLAKDESERLIKEELMKKLTNAWEKRDYYQLLMSWIEIDPQNTINLEITEQNQKSITKQLNNKIRILTDEKNFIKSEDSPYGMIYLNFYHKDIKKVKLNIEDFMEMKMDDLEETKIYLDNFKQTKNLKSFISARVKENNDDDLFFHMLQNAMWN